MNVGLLVVQIIVMIHPMYLWKCTADEKKRYDRSTNLTISNPYTDPDNVSHSQNKP